MESEDSDYQAMVDDDEALDTSYIQLNESQNYPSFRVNGRGGQAPRAGSAKPSLLDKAIADSAEGYSLNVKRSSHGNTESRTYM